MTPATLGVMTRKAMSDAEIVDLYWATSGDDWAIPETVMIAFARAVLVRANPPAAVCSCGRAFQSMGGFANHSRTCEKELARVREYLAAIGVS